MAKHSRISVVLTREGKAALEGEPFYRLTATEHGHFNCESAEDHGSFQRFKLELPALDGKQAVTFELDLPTHLILYMMTAVPEVQKRLGFDG